MLVLPGRQPLQDAHPNTVRGDDTEASVLVLTAVTAKRPQRRVFTHELHCQEEQVGHRLSRLGLDAHHGRVRVGVTQVGELVIPAPVTGAKCRPAGGHLPRHVPHDDRRRRGGAAHDEEASIPAVGLDPTRAGLAAAVKRLDLHSGEAHGTHHLPCVNLERIFAALRPTGGAALGGFNKESLPLLHQSADGSVDLHRTGAVEDGDAQRGPRRVRQVGTFLPSSCIRSHAPDPPDTAAAQRVYAGKS